MDKPFKVADIHAWIKQVTEGQISYSRMVELMNEQSETYAAKQSQKQHLVELMKMDEGKDGEPCFTEEDLINLRVMDLPSEQLNYLNRHTSQYATDRAKKLSDWKESAMQVLSNIDLQEIGKEIGVPLGEDISSKILPWIKNAKRKGLLPDKDYPCECRHGVKEKGYDRCAICRGKWKDRKYK